MKGENFNEKEKFIYLRSTNQQVHVALTKVAEKKNHITEIRGVMVVGWGGGRCMTAAIKSMIHINLTQVCSNICR